MTLWTVARQAPLSIEFSRQEYWSGLPFPSLGDLPNPGIEPRSFALQADALTSEPNKWASLVAQMMKNLPAVSASEGDTGLIAGLENSMDRGIWQAAVQGVTKSWA